MFIEMPIITGVSSVGAASAPDRGRSYGARERRLQPPINIALLRSGGTCVETNAAEVAWLYSFQEKEFHHEEH